MQIGEMTEKQKEQCVNDTEPHLQGEPPIETIKKKRGRPFESKNKPKTKPEKQKGFFNWIAGFVNKGRD
jgi:hypothetical protein